MEPPDRAALVRPGMAELKRIAANYKDPESAGYWPEYDESRYLHSPDPDCYFEQIDFYKALELDGGASASEDDVRRAAAMLEIERMGRCWREVENGLMPLRNRIDVAAKQARRILLHPDKRASHDWFLKRFPPESERHPSTPSLPEKREAHMALIAWDCDCELSFVTVQEVSRILMHQLLYLERRMEDLGEFLQRCSHLRRPRPAIAGVLEWQSGALDSARRQIEYMQEELAALEPDRNPPEGWDEYYHREQILFELDVYRDSYQEFDIFVGEARRAVTAIETALLTDANCEDFLDRLETVLAPWHDIIHDDDNGDNGDNDNDDNDDNDY
jgi:hypothetical protein